MPFPILQQAIQARSSDKLGCRVFVSYSHKDAEEAKQFMDFFSVLLRGIPEVLITEEQVFYDQGRILAGDDWNASIQYALLKAQFFILLISVHSLSSKYCVSRELATAVKQGLIIVPILLNHCPWEKQPLPNDPGNRRLGALHLLPIDDRGGIRPIASWPGKDKADAWNEVMKQLAARLLKDEAQPASSTPAPIKREITHVQPFKNAPLLPYMCNQIGPVNEFNRGVRGWKHKALLVLAKGIHADNLPRFWDRLQNKNLKDYIQANNAQLFRRRPLIWPLRAGESMTPDERAATMLSALSEALTENGFTLKDIPALSRWLNTQSGVVILTTALPAQPKKLIASGLRSLLGILETCPADTPLERLVIAILIEDEDLVRERNFIKAREIKDFQRTHLIDLMPLKQIEKNDIRVWHNDYEIERLHNVTEETLLKTILSETPDHGLRMREFADKFKILIQL